jgi:hypothetical protein
VNILSKVSKTASDFLAVVRASGVPEKVITCCADTQPQPDKHGVMQGGLPQGHFNVQHPNGKRTLGYNDSSMGYCWSVPEEFIHPLSKKIIKLNVPRQALFVFRLSLRFTQTNGMAKIGNHYVFDTEQQPGQWDGNVEYYRDDNQRYKPLDDRLDGGLWGGGGYGR